MNRKRLDPNTLPYDVAEFAEKHDLTLKAALAVLTANSRSREQADIGADLFKREMEKRRQRTRTAQSNPSSDLKSTKRY